MDDSLNVLSQSLSCCVSSKCITFFLIKSTRLKMLQPKLTQRKPTSGVLNHISVAVGGWWAYSIVLADNEVASCGIS